MIESMSAHADSKEILRWLGGFTRPRDDVHRARRAVRWKRSQATIKSKLGWNTKMPQHDETVELV